MQGRSSTSALVDPGLGSPRPCLSAMLPVGAWALPEGRSLDSRCIYTSSPCLYLAQKQVSDHLPAGDSDSVVQGDEIQGREEGVGKTKWQHEWDPA